MARQDRHVVEQDAGRLAGPVGGGDDSLQGGAEARIVELPGDPHAVAQVGRADEQDVDAVDRGDLGCVLDGARRFDLDDPDDPLVDRADVGVARARRGRRRASTAPGRGLPSGG